MRIERLKYIMNITSDAFQCPLPEIVGQIANVSSSFYSMRIPRELMEGLLKKLLDMYVCMSQLLNALNSSIVWCRIFWLSWIRAFTSQFGLEKWTARVSRFNWLSLHLHNYDSTRVCLENWVLLHSSLIHTLFLDWPGSFTSACIRKLIVQRIHLNVTCV